MSPAILLSGHLVSWNRSVTSHSLLSQFIIIATAGPFFPFFQTIYKYDKHHKTWYWTLPMSSSGQSTLK